MRATAVVDLGYGDAGKGVVVDRLCARGDVGVVVRWNGGCQAAHNVTTDDGRHHTFAQFGSGTFHGVPTYLAAPVMVEPLSMLIEASALMPKLDYLDPMTLMHVSPDCLVTTPFHWLVNRWQEDQRGDKRHGSCGRGIGMTQSYALSHPDDALRVRDLQDVTVMFNKLDKLKRWAQVATNFEIDDVAIGSLGQDYQDWLKQVRVEGTIWLKDDRDHIVFEGAQGMLLDEDWGFHPHTTWSHVSPDWVRSWCSEQGVAIDLHVMGVVRAYSTRHGAGPMPSEDNNLVLPESHNKQEHYQGAWRVGHFDAVATRYAIEAAGGVDSVYVTHLDTAAMESRLKVVAAYVDPSRGKYRVGYSVELLLLDPNDFAAREAQTRLLERVEPLLTSQRDVNWGPVISRLLGVPLAGCGLGPHTGDGIWREVSAMPG